MIFSGRKASGKTLHGNLRRLGRPHSSVKQMAARLKEGEMGVTFSVHSGRKRKNTKQDRKKIEKRVREVPETSEHQASTTLVLDLDR